MNQGKQTNTKALPFIELSGEKQQTVGRHCICIRLSAAADPLQLIRGRFIDGILQWSGVEWHQMNTNNIGSEK